MVIGLVSLVMVWEKTISWSTSTLTRFLAYGLQEALFVPFTELQETLFVIFAGLQEALLLIFADLQEELLLIFTEPQEALSVTLAVREKGKKHTFDPLADIFVTSIVGVCFVTYEAWTRLLHFYETNFQKKNMELQEELEQRQLKSAQLQHKIKEQEINLEKGQLKSAQLQRKIKEQEINLEEKKSRSAQLQQKIKEQEIKLKQPGRLPCYRMSRRPRGICVIINNINFRGDCKRVGVEFDEIELARLYTELQFEVHPFRDLQWDEMRRVAVDFSKKDHSQFDAFAFIVMSHGGDKDVIYGVSGRHIRVEDLMSEFKAANCPTLRNKPKLFIIQTCRGSSNDSLSPASCGSDTAAVFSHDSTLARSVCPQEADFLLSFATAPGYKAWRYPGFGTPYIQCLVEEIRKHHHSHHLLDILTEVNRRVVEEGIRDGKALQCPAPTHTLQGQVFL